MSMEEVMFRSRRNYMPAIIQRSETTPGCRHHWVIEKARGPISRGTCRLCGEEKDFRNFSDDFYWERETPAATPPTLKIKLDEEEEAG